MKKAFTFALAACMMSALLFALGGASFETVLGTTQKGAVNYEEAQEIALQDPVLTKYYASESVEGKEIFDGKDWYRAMPAEEQELIYQAMAEAGDWYEELGLKGINPSVSAASTEVQ